MSSWLSFCCSCKINWTGSAYLSWMEPRAVVHPMATAGRRHRGNLLGRRRQGGAMGTPGAGRGCALAGEACGGEGGRDGGARWGSESGGDGDGEPNAFWAHGHGRSAAQRQLARQEPAGRRGGARSRLVKLVSPASYRVCTNLYAFLISRN